ncbi:MAG TPA: hypothetical protein VF337_00555 [Candidatus Limnocylindrales bacterium]
MPEHMVRCFRCHEVFDAEAGPCTKCGAPYTPPAPRPEVIQGLYTDKYAVDDLPPLDPSLLPPVSASARRPNTQLLVGGGAALIVTALVVGLLYVVGAVGGQSATPRPQAVIVSVTAAPTTAPLPTSIKNTLAILNDPMLSVQVKIVSHIEASAAVAGTGPTAMTIKFDGEVSNGNQWGMLQQGSLTQELRLIDGQLYRRFPPSAKWEKLGGMPPYLMVLPLLGVTKDREIQFIKQEKLNDRDVLHLQTTRFWTPDLSRTAMMDMSGYLTGPDVEVLDLWTALDGTPVSAKFSGTRTTGVNTKLLDVEVSYTFTQVGLSQVIDVPGPHWAPSPTATAAH